MRPPHVSVVIPCYRAEGTLRELHARLSQALPKIAPDYEIILVDDRGGDSTWEVIQSLAAADPRVLGVQLSRNFGQHAATICGISKSRGEWVLTLDDDLEQPPEFIPQLYAKAQEGFDLVYGVYPERTHSRWRNVTSELARTMFRIAIPNLNDVYTSYRLIRGDTARALSQFDAPFPFVDGYLSWVTNACGTVSVEHGRRPEGGSTYTLSKLIHHTLNIFVTFSDLPLKFSSWIGLFSFFFGMGWLLIILLGRLTGLITVSGFASIMAAIILFGGFQMLVLGIIGEYLGRMNFRLSRKPLFLVGKETSSTAPHDAVPPVSLVG